MFLSNVHRPLFFGLTRIYSLFIATFFAFIVKFRMQGTVPVLNHRNFTMSCYTVWGKKKKFLHYLIACETSGI